jgi:hypothetical protein
MAFSRNLGGLVDLVEEVLRRHGDVVTRKHDDVAGRRGGFGELSRMPR